MLGAGAVAVAVPAIGEVSRKVVEIGEPEPVTNDLRLRGASPIAADYATASISCSITCGPAINFAWDDDPDYEE